MGRFERAARALLLVPLIPLADVSVDFFPVYGVTSSASVLQVEAVHPGLL